MSSKTQSRYPGIRAFEQKEKHLFFGRQNETQRLYSLIKTQSLVVLFAKSGIGKSSLVNAGIVPLMGKDNYYPIRIRFQDLNTHPEKTFKEALQAYLNKDLLKRNTDQPESCGAWEYLRACEFKKNGTQLTPVIILDQFEEFFDHDLESQNAITLEFADIVTNRLPNRIQNRLRSIPFTKRTDEDLLWHNPIQVKLLIAIRSDRMSLLDNLSSEIPGILQNRFQLKALNHNAAREAILIPAQSNGSEFTTPPFSYDEPVLNKILDGLSNKKGEIESFQLQLLCQHIEKKIQKDKVLEKGFIVREDFFENEKGFKAALNSILNNYYENELAELSNEERNKAKSFIEEGLIIAGRRAGLTEGVEKERYQVDKALLEKLLESRLIRKENTHLGISFEISHDTLVPPILSSYEKRKILEEKKERSIRRKKERWRLITASSLALVGFTLAGFALIFYFRADVAKAEAEESLRKFKEQRLESTRDRYQRFLTSGQSNLNDNKFESAIIAYEQAQQVVEEYAQEVEDISIIQKITNGNETSSKIAEARKRAGNEIEFEQLFNKGEEMENKGKEHFYDAKQFFLQAKTLNYNNNLVDARLLRLNEKLENAFDEFSRNGKIFFNAQAYKMALDNYNHALRIKSGDSELKKQVARCRAYLK